MKKMKVLLPFAVVGLMLSLGACGGPGGGESGKSTTPSVAPQPKVTVKTADDKTSLTLVVGENGQLKASEEGVTWASNNEKVATVDQTGKVTAVAAGTAKISAAKEGFKTGELTVTVNRKPPIATLHMEDADHNAADGFWYNSNRGPELTPVYEKSSASDGTCIGYFGEGDVEVLKFTSSAAIKAELVLTMGHNSSFESLATIMDAKLNNAAIALENVAYNSDSDGQGGYTFQGVSLGELDLVAGENALEFDLKGNAPYLDDLMIYSETAATIAKVDAPAKETIVMTNSEESLALTAEDTLQLTSATTGLSYHSRSETVATVDENGLVTAVAKGSAVIEVYKAGMISAKVTVTVAEKITAGEIRAQAEDGTCEGAAIEEADTKIIKRTTSGGETCTAQWEAEAVLTIKFNAEKAGAYSVYLNGRAGGQYGTANIDDLKAVIEVKVNNVAIAIPDAFAISGRTFTDYLLGNANLTVGENTIEVKAIGESDTAPNIDFFKLVPNA